MLAPDGPSTTVVTHISILPGVPEWLQFWSKRWYLIKFSHKNVIFLLRPTNFSFYYLCASAIKSKHNLIENTTISSLKAIFLL